MVKCEVLCRSTDDWILIEAISRMLVSSATGAVLARVVKRPKVRYDEVRIMKLIYELLKDRELDS